MRETRAFIVLVVMAALMAPSCTASVAGRYPPGYSAPVEREPQATPPETGDRQSDATDATLPVRARLVELRGQSFVELHVGDRQWITPGQQPLFTATQCTVSVRPEEIDEGILLHITLRNETDAPAATPDFHIAGVNLPQEESQILDNWTTVHFKTPRPFVRPHLNVERSYPAQIYSPVLGIRTADIFVGSSFMFPALDAKKEVSLDYEYNRRAQTWSMRYRIWDERNFSDSASGRFEPAVFAPGERMDFTIAVTAAEPSRWVTAFRPYRDFFRTTYGGVRYAGSREPVRGVAMGLVSRISPLNPKGYGTNWPAQQGRLDIVGWQGFYRRIMNETHDLGYRRIMLWQVPGSYREHRNMNMAWEITSSWSPVMYETADELRRLHRAGITIGFWWGRALSISGGFDSGHRHAWDPDNEEDNEAAFRELDLAYDMGVRLIGLDATRRSVFPGDLTPSSEVLFRRIFPMLHERYPEMQWVIEPAACDFLHVWGASYIWAYSVHGPAEFMDYLLPGHESLVAMGPSQPLRGQEEPNAHMNRGLLRQYMLWGYTPLVFSAERFDMRVDRSVLARTVR